MFIIISNEMLILIRITVFENYYNENRNEIVCIVTL